MDYSDYISLSMFVIVLLYVYFSFKGIKINKNESREIKDWSSRNLWKGSISTARLISWKQLQATHNIDYFYSFTVESELGGSLKQYSAAGVVKASEVGKLRKGLVVTIKHQGIPPKKIAVIGVDFD
ncbi:hypothetical protein [Serratia rubidaea]|uniref:DUF3592 domain-containing protein n=1 Tax=Serratia rubidaea TaxID=61652 RepID=A0A448S7S1_SERRU|nr:hypothetical protein [Serratia rubidaea]MDC6116804.1 hypothetical protein [Serratia rubidaea]MEB7588000.1 hypothetical protein [Serratia rubidaea]VEI63755.1 Uncharacterised protein [Serratia rubidaea]